MPSPSSGPGAALRSQGENRQILTTVYTLVIIMTNLTEGVHTDNHEAHKVVHRKGDTLQSKLNASSDYILDQCFIKSNVLLLRLL